jgi:hypothetical protein
MRAIKEHSLRYKKYFKLDIIGDGDAATYLKHNAMLLKCQYLVIEFHGVIPADQVEKRFLSLTNLAVGMGTSLLDASRFAIPTICIDPCDHFQNHLKTKYRWLFESKGYSLGGYESKSIKYLDEIMKEFYNDEKSIGVKCFEYAKQNHSAEIIFANIENILTMQTGFNASVHINRIVNAQSKLVKILNKFKQVIS